MNGRQIEVRMIPIEHITIINPRQRSQKKFRQIVANIGQVGLKKPITVTEYLNEEGQTRYYLACGQGRVEAYKTLGQTEIPAIIVDVSKEEALLISLIENLARRQRATFEMAKDIGDMKDQGYSPNDIARKTGLDVSYVNGIIKLLNKGKERLLQAVEKHQIPLSVAVMIAVSNDKAVQKAMTEAYEKKELRAERCLKHGS